MFIFIFAFNNGNYQDYVGLFVFSFCPFAISYSLILTSEQHVCESSAIRFHCVVYIGGRNEILIFSYF